MNTLAAAAALVAAIAYPAFPTLSDKEAGRVDDGKIVMLTQSEGEGRSFMQGIALVEAEPSAIWAILMDEEHMKASSSAVESVSFYDDHTENGLRTMGIAWTLKVAFREISYSTRRIYDEARSFMTWTLDDTRTNDLKYTEGSYSTYPGPRPGTTYMLYRSKVDVGDKVPSWLEDDLAESGIKKYLKYLQETAGGK